MARGPSQAVKRKVGKILVLRQDTQDILDDLDEKAIVDLLRRFSISTEKDGYPPSSSVERTSGGSISSPTERAVLAREKDNHHPDALDKYAKDFTREVELGYKHWDRAIRILQQAGIVAAKPRGRQSSDPCTYCPFGTPVAVGGFCKPCYKDWHNHGSPNKTAWQAWKMKTTNSEGELLSPDCPKPSPGKVCRRGPWRKVEF